VKIPAFLARSFAGASLLLALGTVPAHGQTLFLNGLPNGVGGVSSEQDLSVSQSMIYDDFIVGGSGWNVTGLSGYFLSQYLTSTAAWEIRSGISLGDGGSLLESGTSSMAMTATGNTVVGLTEYQTDISGLSFFLAPGTYWMGISLINGTSGGQAFVEVTSGSGGVNSDPDLLAFWNSSFFGADFASAEDAGLTGPSDFAYDVEGTAAEINTVPEPSTMALFATGLVGMAGAGVKRRRRK
jgi:hypothetical protein